MPEWGGPVVRWICDKITFPSPPSSYSLTSHPELFFIKSKKDTSSQPGVPCMLYAIPQGAPVVLVHVHSNGCDIGDMRHMLQSISEQLRVHVMSFELPGYGLHVGKSCNRATIDAMGSLVRDFLLEELNINPAQVVWYGRSIGSGPAIYQTHFSQTALKKQPAGLIVQCAYANFPELAGHLFGNWVKCLVPVNWPNEAMIKDIKCPLLILHGRADTMIPIAQAERNFAAVSPEAKDLSKFHACDCGHNDFNFQRCTLRPIYDFLLGIISSDNFPKDNFNIDLDRSQRAFVHHIGPLRNKIPVYSFRRPELDDWIRRVQARKQQLALEVTSDQKDGGEDDVTAKAMERRGPDSVMSAFQKQALEGPGKSGSVESPQSTEETPKEGGKVAKKKGKKKGKKVQEEPPPIPDFSEFPPIQEIEEALLDPEGLIRTCAVRMKSFLVQLAKQIDSIQDLENKPIEEILDFVEAEFWASDPLLGLWEEVHLSGDWVRIRLGPYYIDSSGKSGYDPDIGVGRACSSNPDLMRVPLWVFCPSTAQFRCLAEWMLLQSEILLKRFPVSSGSCSCSPCRCLCCRRRKPRGRNGRRPQEASSHPTRGGLATSLAAHFANWVDKTEEVKSVFSRFVSLYRQPQQALGRSVAAALEAAGQSQASKDILSTMTPLQDSLRVAPPSGQTPPQPHQPDTDVTPTGTSAPVKSAAHDVPKAPSGLESFASALGIDLPTSGDATRKEDPGFRYADFRKVASSPSERSLRPPWSGSMFSAAGRMCLREGSGAPGNSLCEFYTRLWKSDAPKAATPLAIADFKACSDIVSAQPSTMPDRNADWLAANLLLHYNRLLPRPSDETSPGKNSNLLRAEVRQASIAVNKVMKVFAHSDHRERREQMRQRFRPTPKVPLPPDVPPEGDMEESKPGPTMGKPAAPGSFASGESTERPSTQTTSSKQVSVGSLSPPVGDREDGPQPPSSRTL